MKIVETYGTEREVGRAHLNLGDAYNNAGQYHTSIECHRKHLKIAQELKDKHGVGKAHANLGIAYHNIGQYKNQFSAIVRIWRLLKNWRTEVELEELT